MELTDKILPNSPTSKETEFSHPYLRNWQFSHPCTDGGKSDIIIDIKPTRITRYCTLAKYLYGKKYIKSRKELEEALSKEGCPKPKRKAYWNKKNHCIFNSGEDIEIERQLLNKYLDQTHR